MKKLSIIGNLTKDVVVRTVKTATGEQTVANFSVAANEGSGAHKTTEYVNVACWNNLSKVASSYLKKGSKVYVEGDWKVQLYKNSQNLVAYSIEMTARNLYLLDSAPKQDSNNGIAGDIAPAKGSVPAEEPNSEEGFKVVTDPDLPF